jgi:hypothetical protein
MRLFVFIAALTWAMNAAAGDVYEKPRTFVQRAFSGRVPQPQALWITRAMQLDIERILGHSLNALRVRYWRHDDKTVWVLEEIGKEKPITAGFEVVGGRIQRSKVLVFRESRGWEIRYPFFTDQFHNARLEDSLHLDRSIDGVSGATLSVRAMKNMARLALYLDRRVRNRP